MKSDDHGAFITVKKDGLGDAIGSLFINFALLNSNLNGAVSALLRLNLDQARALVLPLMPRAKIEILVAYTKVHWEKSDAKQVDDLCKRALKLTDYRNNIAHGDMIKRDEASPVELALYKGAGRFKPRLETLAPDEVAHAAMHSLYLAAEFRKLGVSITQGGKYALDDPPPQAGQ